jgi:hypothetical protein
MADFYSTGHDRDGRPHITPYEVFAPLPGGLAIISTKWRYRVFVEGTNEILAEMVAMQRAEKIARYFNNKNPDKRALIVSYVEGAEPVFVKSGPPRDAAGEVPRAPRFRMA